MKKIMSVTIRQRPDITTPSPPTIHPFLPSPPPPSISSPKHPPNHPFPPSPTPAHPFLPTHPFFPFHPFRPLIHFFPPLPASSAHPFLPIRFLPFPLSIPYSLHLYILYQTLSIPPPSHTLLVLLECIWSKQAAIRL